MKALTLWQPWASLVMEGRKTFETRSWSTSYRGWLAVHAAKTQPSWVRAIYHKPVNDQNHLFWQCLSDAGFSTFAELPRGVVLGFVRVSRIVPVEHVRHQPDGFDLAFGDWTPGRYAWYLKDVTVLPESIPARGRQGLWEWHPPVGVILPI